MSSVQIDIPGLPKPYTSSIDSLRSYVRDLSDFLCSEPARSICLAHPNHVALGSDNELKKFSEIPEDWWLFFDTLGQREYGLGRAGETNEGEDVLQKLVAHGSLPLVRRLLFQAVSSDE